jgi:hypothetical protein
MHKNLESDPEELSESLDVVRVNGAKIKSTMKRRTGRSKHLTGHLCIPGKAMPLQRKACHRNSSLLFSEGEEKKKRENWKNFCSDSFVFICKGN